MKRFKQILEDVRLMNTVGLRTEGPFRTIKTFKVEEMGSPVATIGNYNVYQIHHGRQTHRGHGKFIDINDPETSERMRNWDIGGAFVVHHPTSNSIVGTLNYAVYNENRPKELHITDLHAVEGYTGIRKAIFDTAADKLGYTMISDHTQTHKGKRGWENDIMNGEPVSVRYYHDYARGLDSQFDEVPIDSTNYKDHQIWSVQNYPREHINPETGMKHDPSDILLVRRPKVNKRVIKP